MYNEEGVKTAKKKKKRKTLLTMFFQLSILINTTLHLKLLLCHVAHIIYLFAKFHVSIYYGFVRGNI